MPSRELIKRLLDAGWVLHHVKGSHHQYRHAEKSGKITVPHPKKDFPIGTLNNIYTSAGWSWKGRKK